MEKNTAQRANLGGGDRPNGNLSNPDSLTQPPRQEFSSDRLSAKRQELTAHLYAAGPRPVLEALLAVASGQDLDAVLADFARIPVSIYHAVGADVLPIHRGLQ
jgi:hypothetical protein